MIDEVVALLEEQLNGLPLSTALLMFMLIFTRWSVMTVMMPFLGGQILPSLVRVAISSSFSAVGFLVSIAGAGAAPHHIDSVPLIAALFIKEALLGFILGFLASLIFYCYEIFGQLIDLARAASMSKMLVPEMKHQSSIMGSMLFQLALMMYLMAGFHRLAIEAAIDSFAHFPALSLTAPIFNHDFFLSSLGILSSLLNIALKFSLPVMAICFLIDLAFGLMNRVAPQINAYFLSLPAKILGGLVMLFFFLPFLIDDFSDHHHLLSSFFYRFLSYSSEVP